MAIEVKAFTNGTLCLFILLLVIRGYSTLNCTVRTEQNETIVNCTDRGFFALPTAIPANVTVLLLGSNIISSVPAGAFMQLTELKTLDFSYNKALLSFHQDSFLALKALKNLSLTNMNGVSFGCDQGSSRLFRSTPQLQTLRMKRTERFDTTCVNYTFRDLTNLRYLSITWPTSPLPTGFSHLRALDILDLSHSTLNLMESNFQPLSFLNISRLALRKLRVLEFSKHALNPVLRSLKVLDFSCNYLEDIGVTTKYFSPVLECLENSTLLEVLIIDSCYYYDDKAITITAEQFYPLKQVPLKALSLRQNAITIVRPFLRHLQHLEYINVDYNMPSLFKDSAGIFMDLFKRRCLKEFHFSYQFLYSRVRLLCEEDESEIFMRDFSDKCSRQTKPETAKSNTQVPDKSLAVPLERARPNPFVNRNGNRNMEVVLSKTGLRKYGRERYLYDGDVVRGSIPLEKLHVVKMGIPVMPLTVEGERVYDVNISDFVTNGVRVQLKNNLRYLNVSSNFLSCMDFVLYGFDCLEILDISSNNLEHVSTKQFKAFGNLEHLMASRNRFGLFRSSEDLVTTFSNLPRIRTIDLALNSLTSLPEGMFSQCPLLEYLNLERNGIKVVNIEFATLPSLKLLDLSHNEIKGFTKDQTDDLKRGNFVLQMNNNSGFECSCGNIPFIEWIQSDASDGIVLNKNNLTCQYEDGKITSLRAVQGLYIQCIKDTIIITVSSLTSVALCTALIVWRYQWHVRYWIYILRLKRRRDTFVEVSKCFDAFISYSDEDHNLAASVFRKLEEMGLQIFFRERDTVIGACVLDESFRGIESSREIVLCLTESYLNSDQCYFELRMSMLRGKGFVIPVVVGDVALEKLSKPLRHLLREGVYFEWPTLESEEKDFWKSMKKAVLTAKGIRICKNGAVMYYAD